MATYFSGRYAPMYWLQRWDEANQNREHEVALGYAHLALVLCEQFFSALHPKGGVSEYIETGLAMVMASLTCDAKNLAENESVLYFEGLKLIACRNIKTSLLSIGYFEEAKIMMEFILTPENWLVGLSSAERARLAATLEGSVKYEADQAKRRRGGKTYLRHDAWLWKNPYDVNLSKKEGIDRLNTFIFHSRTDINPKQPWDMGRIMESLRFVRDPQGKPGLYTHGVTGKYGKGPIKKDTTIFAEGTVLAVTSDMDSPTEACEDCLCPAEIHLEDVPQTTGKKPGDNDNYVPCCSYARDRIWTPCIPFARKHYHKCVDWDEYPEMRTKDDELYQTVWQYSESDFGHALLLLRRVINVCQKITNRGMRIHPLQYDVIPYLPSDCERVIPWSYRAGIVEVIDLLLKEGIDPFVDDDWNIRTILILWRKLGPIDWHLITQESAKTADGEPMANFSCLFPIYPFLRHSCKPNARLIIKPYLPSKMVLVALRDIKPGEQITISRIDMDYEQDKPRILKERRDAFVAMGMKPCECQECMLDTRRNIVNKMGGTNAPVNPKLFRDADRKEYQKRCLRRLAAIAIETKKLREKYPLRKLTEEEMKLYSNKTAEEVLAENWHKEQAKKRKTPPSSSVGTKSKKVKSEPPKPQARSTPKSKRR